MLNLLNWLIICISKFTITISKLSWWFGNNNINSYNNDSAGYICDGSDRLHGALMIVTCVLSAFVLISVYSFLKKLNPWGKKV